MTYDPTKFYQEDEKKVRKILKKPIMALPEGLARRALGHIRSS